MGAWYFHALSNDAGLDELGLLFGKSNLVQHVQNSLEQDLHECPDEIRATAFLVYVLAKEELWPHDSLREITSLAISRLTQMLAEKIYRNANFVAELRHLIGQLREVALAHTICDGPRSTDTSSGACQQPSLLGIDVEALPADEHLVLIQVVEPGPSVQLWAAIFFLDPHALFAAVNVSATL